MKNSILTLVLLLAAFGGFSQIETTWDDLAEVKFVDKYSTEFDDFFLYPRFSKSVKDLEGQKISVHGFFLNIDPESEIYVLSKGPMASCFFCGVGGPETAIELEFNFKPKFKTDDVVIVTGTLKLNWDDVEHFYYILTDCTAELAK